MMIECCIDSREQSLYEDIKKEKINEMIPISMKMLPLGDVIIRKKEGEEILMMIERKTVRDLIHSLKDGRYHDQRKRWLEFVEKSPNSFVSLWIEGDLMSTDMEDSMKGSLLNSLFRLQSKHHILVHHARSRDGFVKSLVMVMEKFEKDPYHLVSHATASSPPICLSQFKKSSHSGDTYWRDCLCLVPGVSAQTAMKLVDVFPSMMELVEKIKVSPETTYKEIAQIKISEKRILGEKLATKILCHVCPSSFSSLDQKK